MTSCHVTKRKEIPPPVVSFSLPQEPLGEEVRDHSDNCWRVEEGHWTTKRLGH